PPKFLIIGAGSRGTAYAQAVTTSTPGTIHAVAEPHTFKRQHLGRSFIWGEKQPGAGQEFTDWRDWVEYETLRRERSSKGGESNKEEGVDGVFVCTLDETHVEILLGIAHLGVHVLCEKPLGVDLRGCLDVWRAYSSSSSSSTTSSSSPPPEKKQKKQGQKQIFSIGHVLRYSPHNLLLRKLLLDDNVIGDVVSLEHVEPVGWWHFSHSYVRGNWRRETSGGVGSLLTKSCHDVDFVMWLLSYPSSSHGDGEGQGEEGGGGDEDIHYPSTITSTGHLAQFHPRRKPAPAGSHTNCVTCPAERECLYSAVKIYRDMHLRQGKTEWPVNIVCPDIEDFSLSSSPGEKEKAMAKAEHHLMEALREDYDASTTPDEVIASRPWYGRCVYEADNNVCDDQVVTISWNESLPSTSTSSSSSTPKKAKESKTATIHMIAPTQAQCVRRGRIYGTTGELTYDSSTISYFDFSSGKTVSIPVPRQSEAEEKAHGGGDYGLARGFVGAVDAVVNGGMGVEKAQRRFVGCSLREIIVSHGVVFAAEGARRHKEVVGWEGWWGKQLGGV
ncbi:streptomycin biosynthesis protein StrI, partial [Aspergillus campestris IBT 28561]